MMIVGLGFKLSLVPFQLWTPDVYQGAPAPVSTFPATASKIAIFAVVMRLFLYAPAADNEALRMVLSIIAFCSILFGNLMAISQTNIKRLLGYSSIAHGLPAGGADCGANPPAVAGNRRRLRPVTCSAAQAPSAWSA